MTVLPTKTVTALPSSLHCYMKDINSPIIDYYPSNFHIDLIGKKFAWLGEVILPFIDDRRLLSVIGNYE
jgi:5'-3' exoribonuclease 2